MFDYIRHYQKQDPVKPGFWEVLLVYPGVHAMLIYRFSHLLWHIKLHLIARICSHFGRFLTGIEIHPAAQIGKNLFIDHGMGVVIGETAIIGNNVTIFHGVTLGSYGIPSLNKNKRHPTIKDNVIIAAGAKVLGNITIYEHAKIGPNAVVTSSVPAYATIGNIPSRISKHLDDWII